MLLNLWFSYRATPECSDISKVTKWVENLVENKIGGFLSNFSEIKEDESRRYIDSRLSYTPHSSPLIGVTALFYFSDDCPEQSKIMQQVVNQLSDTFDKLIFQDMSKHSNISSFLKNPNITVESIRI